MTTLEARAKKPKWMLSEHCSRAIEFRFTLADGTKESDHHVLGTAATLSHGKAEWDNAKAQGVARMEVIEESTGEVIHVFE